MTREPFYKFDNLDSKGINDVPAGSLIVILDPTGFKNETIIVKKLTAGVYSNNTIRTFINDALAWTYLT